MSLIVHRKPSSAHPDYGAACNQTVTIYNVYKDGNETKFHMTVFDKSAFLEQKRLWQEQKTGSTANNSSLLVIPQGASGKKYVSPVEFDDSVDKVDLFTLRNGDKALSGIGNIISSVSDWAKLTPSSVAGVVVISTAEVKRNLAGDIVHIEGGS